MIAADLDHMVQRYKLTSADLERAKMLSPETTARLKTMAAEITEDLADYRFSGSPEEVQTKMLSHAHTQGQRDTLLLLLDDSANAYGTATEHNFHNPGVPS